LEGSTSRFAFSSSKIFAVVVDFNIVAIEMTMKGLDENVADAVYALINISGDPTTVVGILQNNTKLMSNKCAAGAVADLALAVKYCTYFGVSVVLCCVVLCCVVMCCVVLCCVVLCCVVLCVCVVL
jgi:hypothetical protein